VLPHPHLYQRIYAIFIIVQGPQKEIEDSILIPRGDIESQGSYQELYRFIYGMRTVQKKEL